jgi:uncharacterized protein YccT (UPF0319 family)
MEEKLDLEKGNDKIVVKIKKKLNIERSKYKSHPFLIKK